MKDKNKYIDQRLRQLADFKPPKAKPDWDAFYERFRDTDHSGKQDTSGNDGTKLTRTWKKPLLIVLGILALLSGGVYVSLNILNTEESNASPEPNIEQATSREKNILPANTKSIPEQKMPAENAEQENKTGKEKYQEENPAKTEHSIISDEQANYTDDPGKETLVSSPENTSGVQAEKQAAEAAKKQDSTTEQTVIIKKTVIIKDTIRVSRVKKK